jgi:hypothetical protein
LDWSPNLRGSVVIEHASGQISKHNDIVTVLMTDFSGNYRPHRGMTDLFGIEVSAMQENGDELELLTPAPAPPVSPTRAFYLHILAMLDAGTRTQPAAKGVGVRRLSTKALPDAKLPPA